MFKPVVCLDPRDSVESGERERERETYIYIYIHISVNIYVYVYECVYIDVCLNCLSVQGIPLN